MHRHPAVAGYFYRGTAESLKQQVEEFVVPAADKVRALGILSPHAGLIYSGPVAGAVYSRIALPDTIILVGPNHTGLGTPVSVMCEGSWDTPLGSVDVDEALARSILSRAPHMQEDTLAHLREHSLEVQLPFIQYFKKSFTIVPIQMLDTRLDTCLEVGRAVAEAIRSRSQKAEGKGQPELMKGLRAANPELPLIVASSDMSHYERARIAKEKDEKAIACILNLDPEGLYRTIKDYGITMCGYGPAVVMLTACKILGATRAELVKYANSGDVSGDYDQVVGYAGIFIS